jgi:hypothetical protein
MTRTPIAVMRPEDLIHQLERRPDDCVELVHTFSREQLGLKREIASDRDFALARHDGHMIRIKHAGNGELQVQWTNRNRMFAVGDSSRWRASDAVERLVKFANGVE